MGHSTQTSSSCSQTTQTLPHNINTGLWVHLIHQDMPRQLPWKVGISTAGPKRGTPARQRSTPTSSSSRSPAPGPAHLPTATRSTPKPKSENPRRSLGLSNRGSRCFFSLSNSHFSFPPPPPHGPLSFRIDAKRLTVKTLLRPLSLHLTTSRTPSRGVHARRCRQRRPLPYGRG